MAELALKLKQPNSQITLYPCHTKANEVKTGVHKVGIRVKVDILFVYLYEFFGLESFTKFMIILINARTPRLDVKVRI